MIKQIVTPILMVVLIACIVCSGSFGQKTDSSKVRNKAFIDAILKHDSKAASNLLKQGADVNMPLDMGGEAGGKQPAFVAAAALGDIDLVKALIANSGTAWKQHADTALVFAAAYARDRVLQLLLDKGISLNGTAKYGGTLLMMASTLPPSAERGAAQMHIITLLLDKGVKINAQAVDGTTALMLAARSGNGGVIKYLLAHGADLHLKDKRGQTAETFASQEGRQEIVAILQRAEHHTANAGQRLALVKAVVQDDVQKLRTLLQSGGDVNARDDAGDTLLMLAAQEGRLGLMKVLLDFKVDINARSLKFDQYTALYLAAEKGQTAGVNLLLDHHADMTPYTEGSNFSALTRAIVYDRVSVVEAFLAHGADVNAKNNLGSTPLIEDSGYGHPAIVKLLLEHGADRHAMDNDKKTALMWAQQNDDHREDYTEIIRLLLAKGAGSDEKK